MAVTKQIILCATQRSGSTMVCDDFRNNGLGLAEEHLLPLVLSGMPEQSVDEWMAMMQERARDENGVSCIKVMSSYAHVVDAFLRSGGYGEAGEKPWSALATFFQDAVWVRLHRLSILRQAVSRLIARKTGINHAVRAELSTFKPGKSLVGYDSDYNIHLVLDSKSIEDEVSNIAHENARWDLFFDRNHIEPINLYYEDVISDFGYINLVRNVMGFACGSVNGNRNLVRMANETTERIIDGYLTAKEMTQSGPKPCSTEVTMSSAATLGHTQGTDGNTNLVEATGLNIEKLVEETSEVSKRWIDTPYYQAVESLAQLQWDNLIIPFIQDAPIRFGSVLELSCGHGRITSILLQLSEHVTAIDVLESNIDFCRNRFAGIENLTLIKNDGVTLKELDNNTQDFALCFDSMVHFDADIVRAYLHEFARVMKPAAFVFLHHSNRDWGPGEDFNKAQHARNFMSQKLMKYFAHKANLEVIKSEVIDWGTGERLVKGIDCLTLLRKPSTP